MNWLARGFSYLTLDPSRLRRLREESEHASRSPFGPLPPLPDSAYPPGAVPLDCSGIPARPVCKKCGTAACLEDRALDS